MQNGTFQVHHRALKTDYKIVCHNGKITVRTLDKDAFLKTITPETLKEFYHIVKPLKSETKYNIEFYSKGKKEIIMFRESYALALWKINELKKSMNYQKGKLIAVKSNN